MYVESIKANIKSGTPFEYKLGTHTLIIARNGGGKSAISIAVQLALTGAADDVLGKEAVKSGQVLAQLGDSAGAFSVATLSNGSESIWEVLRDGATVKTANFRPAPEVDVDAALPLRAVRAAISGDDKVARATFLRWTSADVNEETVLVELPSMYHERYKAIAKTQPGSPADVLSAVTAYAGTRVAAVADEVRGQEAILNSIQTEGLERPTDEQIATAQANVKQWEAAWEAALKFEAQGQVRERIAVLNGLLETARGRRDEAQVNLSTLEQALANENPPPATHPAMLAMAALCQQHPEVLTGPGCPMCGTEVGAVKLASAGAYYAGVAAPSQPSQLAATVAQWREYAAQREGEYNAAMTELTALEKLVDASLVNIGFSSEQAREGTTQWRTYEAQLTTAKARWDTVRDARDAKARLDAEVPVMRAFHDACKEAVARVFARGVGTFQDRVQRYLPARWRFKLQLRDGDKEVFRPGLVRASGEFDTILSGTEWDSVQVAIAMAVIEGGATVEAPKGKGKGSGKRAKKTGGEQPAVIILSDRDRDEGTLADLMRAWASFPGQVIIEATHKPRGKFPAGWTLIEVEREVPAASEDPAPEVEPTAAPTPEAITPPTPSKPVPPPGMEEFTPASAAAPVAPPLVLPPGLSKPAALPPTPPPGMEEYTPTPASATSTAALLALGFTEADIATMPEAGRAYAVKYNVPRAKATRYGDTTWTFPPPGSEGLPLPVER